jgi:hypothetical protein
MAQDLPDPGCPPNSQFRKASDTSVRSIRGVVANANGLNTSVVPDRSSGQAGWRIWEAGSWPTHKARRPVCPGAGSGHTWSSGSRSPDARRPRRAITSAASTP